MIKDLIKVANELDKRGLLKEADELDYIIRKAQETTVDPGFEKFRDKAVMEKSKKILSMIINGAATLGDTLETAGGKFNLPMTAWLGSVLQVPKAAADLTDFAFKLLAGKIIDLASLLVERELGAKIAGEGFCLSIEDLKEKELDQSFMLILTLLNPSLASSVNAGSLLVERFTQLLPEDSKVKENLISAGDRFLETSLCQTDAGTMSGEVDSVVQDMLSYIEEELNQAVRAEHLIAKNISLSDIREADKQV